MVPKAVWFKFSSQSQGLAVGASFLDGRSFAIDHHPVTR
jgi:hypothetical protein